MEKIKEPEYELARDVRNEFHVIPAGTPVEWDDYRKDWLIEYKGEDGNTYAHHMYLLSTETKESAIKRLIEAGIVREVGR